MIRIYTTDESSEWDKIVRSFKNYDVYYLSGYVKAFMLHGDGEPLLIYCKAEVCRGINVVMKRDISEDKHFTGILEAGTFFDIITPYGYGGWLIEGDGNSDSLFEEYAQWCRKNNIICEFVRYHPVLNNHMQSNGFYDTEKLGNTVCMSLDSEDDIWNNLTSKNRNMVRKAIKSGIKVYNGRCPEIFRSFQEIYERTMDKDNADKYYYFPSEFYRSVAEDLCNEAQIFYAEYEGKIIAASIILAADYRLNYHLSGSVREFQELAPTNLILYKAALWGCCNGCRTFHLGGGVGAKEDSLFKFKKSFYRGSPLEYYIGKKIYDNDKYDMLTGVRKRGTVENTRFFPTYRA